MSKRIFSLLVENEAGVLSRVAGLFSRRGYNIDSLSVGETEVVGISRMTIVTSGEEEVLEQIEKQLNKLIDVKEVLALPEGSVCRELILISIAASPEERQQIFAVADVFRAKVVDVSLDSIMIELTGNEGKLEAFVRLLSPYQILSIARTGLTGLVRGQK